MKILPDMPAALVERTQQPLEPATPFEDMLDLTMLRTLRQKQDRAFAFARRGVLALSDPGGEPTFSSTPPSTPLPPIAAASEVRGPGQAPDQPLEPMSSAVADIRSTGGPTGVVAGPPLRDIHLRAETAAVQVLPSADGASGGVVASMRPDGPEQAMADTEIGGAPLDAPQEAASPGGDTSLTVHWARDGLVVFAAAPIASSDEIGRLRARADEIARAHGRPLIQFHLNGAPVAPQPLSRRL